MPGAALQTPLSIKKKNMKRLVAQLVMQVTHRTFGEGGGGGGKGREGEGRGRPDLAAEAKPVLKGWFA